MKKDINVSVNFRELGYYVYDEKQEKLVIDQIFLLFPFKQMRTKIIGCGNGEHEIFIHTKTEYIH